MNQFPTVQKNRQRNIELKDLIFPVVGGILLSRIPLGNFLFTIPLIVAGHRLDRASKALLPFAIVIGTTLGISAFSCWDALQKTFSYGLFVYLAFVPVSLGLGAALWSYTGFTAMRMRRRYFISGGVASGLSALFIVAMFGNNPVAKDLEENLTFYYAKLLTGFAGLDAQTVFQILVLVTEYALAPLSALLLGFSIVVAESSAHKLDMAWQDSVGRWSIPENFIWVFLGTFFAAILSSVFSLPLILNVIFWNLAEFSCVVYAIQGFAILAFRIRKRNRYYAVHKIALNLAILCVIPIVDVIILAGLPLLGALETWITFRKPYEENSYENHFEP